MGIVHGDHCDHADLVMLAIQFCSLYLTLLLSLNSTESWTMFQDCASFRRHIVQSQAFDFAFSEFVCTRMQNDQRASTFDTFCTHSNAKCCDDVYCFRAACHLLHLRAIPVDAMECTDPTPQLMVPSNTCR